MIELLLIAQTNSIYSPNPSPYLVVPVQPNRVPEFKAPEFKAPEFKAPKPINQPSVTDYQRNRISPINQPSVTDYLEYQRRMDNQRR